MERVSDYMLSPPQTYKLTPEMASGVNLEPNVDYQYLYTIAYTTARPQIDALLKPLRDEVHTLVRAIRELVIVLGDRAGKAAGEANVRQPVTALREMPREQARCEIMDLFRESTEPLYYSDVAERLALDLPTVVELCNELEEEGSLVSVQPGRP